MTRKQMGAVRRTGAGRKGQAGFSLTEVAVALSVSGLLIGGVLKGVEMMEQGRILQAGKLLQETAMGHQMFINKFQYMPGDLGNATELLNAYAQNGNSDHVMTATSSEDGDELADETTDGLYGEAYHYWSHLGAAGMGPGTLGFVGQDTTDDARTGDKAKESVIEGSHSPMFPLGGYMQIVSGTTARKNADDGEGSTLRTLTSVAGDLALEFPQIRVNELYYRIGHGKGIHKGELDDSTVPNFSPSVGSHDMARLDLKFDDGRPSSGLMMTTTAGCLSVTPETGKLPDINYNYMSNAGGACTLLYRVATKGGLAYDGSDPVVVTP